MRTWITKRPLVSFYFLTLTLSWGYWVALRVQGLRVGPGSVAHFPGLLGPMLAAIAVTAMTGGRKALHELFGRMLRLGPHWAVKLMLALSPLASIHVPTLIVSARDDRYGTYASAQYTASRIAGAKFIGFDKGGHTWVGHDAEVMAEIVKLLDGRESLAALPTALGHDLTATNRGSPHVHRSLPTSND